MLAEGKVVKLDAKAIKRLEAWLQHDGSQKTLSPGVPVCCGDEVRRRALALHAPGAWPAQLVEAVVIPFEIRLSLRKVEGLCLPPLKSVASGPLVAIRLPTGRRKAGEKTSGKCQNWTVLHAPDIISPAEVRLRAWIR